MGPIFNRSPSAIMLLLCAACAAWGCRPAAPSNNEPAGQNAAEPESNLAAEVPLPKPPMDRAALLAAVAKARSAAAAGSGDVEAQRGLDGRQFELRIRFGCSGPAADLDDVPFGWMYEPKNRVLRVSATPTITGQDPTVAALKPKDAEAVEGFWLERPWLLQAACPAKPTSATEDNRPTTGEGDPEQFARIGIAQFFTPADPRTTRRDHRPYQATKTLAGDPQVGSQGFDLVLEGRLRAAAGRVILCRSASPDRPPDCIVSARVDRVRFERPDTGEIIAEWAST